MNTTTYCPFCERVFDSANSHDDHVRGIDECPDT
jgi:hypothetical protein